MILLGDTTLLVGEAKSLLQVDTETYPNRVQKKCRSEVQKWLALLQVLVTYRLGEVQINLHLNVLHSCKSFDSNVVQGADSPI